MKRETVIAHAESLATAVLGAVVAAGTTLVGQGVPDPTTQGKVAFAFGCFTWLVAIVHRWKTSPADATHQLLPLIEQVVTRLQAPQQRATLPDGEKP